MNTKYLRTNARKAMFMTVLAGMILSLCFGMSGSPAVRAQEAGTATPSETPTDTVTATEPTGTPTETPVSTLTPIEAPTETPVPTLTPTESPTETVLSPEPTETPVPTLAPTEAPTEPSAPPEAPSAQTFFPGVGGSGPGGAQRGPDGRWFMPAGAQDYNPVEAQDVTALSTGGPDSFGYTWDDSVAFNWVDTTGGTDTGLTGDGWNNATGLISLPFPFKYYENAYSQIYITASGYLSFKDNGYWPSQEAIPSPGSPNNVIAPYWTYAYIGAGSWVHYISGGSAPNRYFVVEWHDVNDWLGSTNTFRFEAILHENGDIVFQYQTMTYTGSYYCGASGIEDSTGLDGLSYVDFCAQAPSSKAVRFYRPAASARLGIFPYNQGRFSSAGALASFRVSILNTGEFGADTYDLTISSPWAASLYAADGVTLLTDTDADGSVDTGPVPQGNSATITIKVQTPGAAVVGDSNTAVLTATSSLNTSMSKAANIKTAVPAPFVQVFMDDADGAMSLDLVQPHGQTAQQVTDPYYWGIDPAIARAIGDNYVYAWSKFGYVDPIQYEDIEFTLLDQAGNTILPVTKLTDNSGATTSVNDSQPAVAVTPDGRIGVLWTRIVSNSDYSQFNYNVYFAILDSAGEVVSGPTNITGNSVWGTWGDLNVPFYSHTQISATGDNNFLPAWQSSHQESGGRVNDVYYAVRSSAGDEVWPITKLTNATAGGSSYIEPVLSSLSSNRAFLSWVSREDGNDDIHYAVLSSDGSIFKGDTDLSVDETVVDWQNWDAVQLPNGKILAVWEAWGCFPGEWTSRIRFVLLDSSYNRIGTPQCLNKSTSDSTGDSGASVTVSGTDYGVITWGDNQWNHLNYALVYSSGSVITQPMIFLSSQGIGTGISTSYTGYGNTSYALTTPPATISGTINDADGNPLTGVTVQVRAVLKSDGSEAALTTSNPADGSYTLTGLPFDQALAVVASDEDPDTDGYPGRYYNNVGDPSWAESIMLTSGSPDRAGVEFNLSTVGVFGEQLTFNVRAGRLLSDVNIRQAIAYGTDRQAILDNAFVPNGVTGEILHSMVMPGLWYKAATSDPLLTVYDFNPTHARDILTAAGWTDTDADGIRENASNEELALDFITTTAPMRVAAADLFKAQMADIGILVNVSTYPSWEFFSDDPAVSPLLAGTFDIAEFAWMLGDDDTLMSIYNTGDPQNHGGYSNPTLDGYFNSARDAKVAGASSTFLDKALNWQYTFSEDLPALPMFTRVPIPFIGTISGTIKDADGNPLTGVTVQVRAVLKSDGSEAATTTSNPADGTYTLTGLPLDQDLAVVASDEDPDTDGYPGRYYNNVGDPSWAESILLTSGSPDRTGVEFNLSTVGVFGEQLTFNVRAGRLLSDVNIRQAIAYGTDRQSILDDAFVPRGTTGEILNSMVMPGLWYTAANDDPLLTVYDFNPTHARDILTAAGWTDTDADGIRENASNVELALDFITTTAPVRVAAADLFKAQMANIGILVNVSTYPSWEFFSDDPAVSPLLAGTFDIAEFAWVLGDDDVLTSGYNASVAYNYGGYSNPTLDGYFNAAREAKVAGASSTFLNKALNWQYTFSEDLPALPMFTRVPINPPPTNDDFYFAKRINGIPYADNVDVLAANQEWDDPNLTQCNRLAGLASVWYKYSPSSAREVSLDTYGSDYDTMIGVWSGTRGNLTPVACNDDAAGTLQSFAAFAANSGTTYYIGISQYNGSASGLSMQGGNDKAVPELSEQSGGTLNFHVSLTTYTISGNSGVGGATLSYTDGSPKTATAGSHGDYAFEVSYNWSGSVTPSMTGYVFWSASRTYNNVLANQTGQNYIASIFSDVPYNYSTTLGGVVYNLHDYIQALYDGGYTAGCGTNPLRYCPDNTLTRAESAVFMLRGMEGVTYTPPTDPSGYVFTDDWSSPGVSWSRPWAEGMWDESLTAGCSSNPLMFCPARQLTRAEASVFGLRIEYGVSYTPPAASHIFADDWSSPGVSWAEPWAEKAYLEGLLPACGTSGGKPLFCPSDLITRAWAAYLIVQAKDLPLP